MVYALMHTFRVQEYEELYREDGDVNGFMIYHTYYTAFDPIDSLAHKHLDIMICYLSLYYYLYLESVILFGIIHVFALRSCLARIEDVRCTRRFCIGTRSIGTSSYWQASKYKAGCS